MFAPFGLSAGDKTKSKHLDALCDCSTYARNRPSVFIDKTFVEKYCFAAATHTAHRIFLVFVVNVMGTRREQLRTVR